MTKQFFNIGITIFTRLARSMEKYFSHKYQLWKLFRRIRNQIAAHAQKGVKCSLNSNWRPPRYRKHRQSWAILRGFYQYHSLCKSLIALAFIRLLITNRSRSLLRNGLVNPETFHLSFSLGNMEILLPVRILCPFLVRKFVKAVGTLGRAKAF